MLEEKDPLAMALFNQYDQVPMPNLKLTDKNTLDLIEFLQTESQRVHAAAAGSNPQAVNPLESILEPEPPVRTSTPPSPGNIQRRIRHGQTQHHMDRSSVTERIITMPKPLKQSETYPHPYLPCFACFACSRQVRPGRSASARSILSRTARYRAGSRVYPKARPTICATSPVAGLLA